MQSQSDAPEGVGSELLSDANNIGSSAVTRLHSEVDARKGDAVNQVKAVATSIGAAASGLDPHAPAWLKSAFEQGAQHMQKFADTLEQKDSRQLANEVGNFAKSSPGTFLAACAAAGFAAARIFKAGSAGNSPSQLGPVGSPDATKGNNQANSSTNRSPEIGAPSGQFA